MGISMNFISGVMLGFEFASSDKDSYLVIDLFIIRCIIFLEN